MIIFTILAAIGNLTHSGSEKEVELMKKIKAKDADALKELYKLYNRLLFGMILSVVKKREEAEDVLQEVFVKIWERASTFNADRGNVYSWVVTIARNKAIDRLRSKDYKTQKKASVYIDDDDTHYTLEGKKFDPLETTIFSDRAQLVKQALDAIPESQREVLQIAYYRGMTQTEISDHLEIPLGTVKTRTRQGMIKMKNLLESYIQQNDQ